MAFAGVERGPHASAELRSPSLLHGYFETQVRRRPNHSAIECAGEVLTYLELDQYANQIAHALRERGVGADSLVGIYLHKSPRVYAAMLGVLKAGGAYVPIDPIFPIQRVKDILADASPVTVLTEGALAEGLALATPIPLLRFDQDNGEITSQPDRRLSPKEIGLDSEKLCYVIYTSGSTGRPKGVMIEHRNAVTFVDALRSVYQVTAKDRVYQGFSTAFDASVEEIWAALAMGGTLVVPSEEILRSPSDVAEFINENQITYFSTVPTFLSMIDRELPTIRTLVLGGEVCRQELVERWANPNRRMLNTYGPTETTVVATWTECTSGAPVTIGRALPGYRTYILDENLKLVPPGEVGELYIGGRGVARGYMNLPELTRERFIPNPLQSHSADRLYRTCDMVRLTETGELQFQGRRDGQLKIRGFRVELAEIEAVLVQYPGVRAAAVGVPEKGEAAELAAYVVFDGGNLDRAALAEYLRRLLPEYMVPKYLDIVDELPMMTSGKVDRRLLPPPLMLLRGEVTVSVTPQDELERVICEAWQKGLKVSQISVLDDFFLDLGGHSLLAAQVVTRLRERLSSARISVRDIYRHRTVRALADELKARGFAIGDAPSPSPEERGTPSEKAFRSVRPITRFTVQTLQGMALLAFYSIVLSPIAYIVLVSQAVVDGWMHWADALFYSTVVGFAVWPAMLAFSIMLKWIVIGRYRPGQYPVWSFYYFRWWLVSRFQALSWSEMFTGTPLMSLYYRAMGASIGKNVTLSTPLCTAFDVVSIGNDSSIGLETQLLGCRVENGMLHIGTVAIGRNCFVGMHCCLGLDTRMEDDARLDDMSLLADGMAMGRGEMLRGVPAIPAHVSVPAAPTDARKRRPFLYGFLHLALIYVMGYFLIATMLPGIALVVAGLVLGGPAMGILAAFLAVPVTVLSYALGALLVKRLCIGRLRAGSMPIESGAYLRHWFSQYLLENTRHILLPLYATVYLPPFLRLLGAKIGKDTEISTVAHITPDCLEVGDGSFLADASLIGGSRIHAGRLETRPVRIGKKTFIGNSALIPDGSVIGENVLIGVASTPPMDWARVPDGTRWLGSPGFALPRTQNDCCFAESETFTPGRRARRERAIIDAGRILIPGFIATAGLVAFAVMLVIASRNLPLWAVLAMIPPAGAVLAVAAVAVVALLKKACMGTMVPTVKPLWCRFVWLNELVNGAYESIAAPAMSAMLGTPFVAPCLRMMGCRVGKRCFIETTLFSEFDLVDIGDYAALNLGATIQTHLFEDRIFKADYLRIGEGCAVGNMAIVLYGADMQKGSTLGPLSVLMKGETLPPLSRWQGIPCEQLTPPDAEQAKENARAYAAAARAPDAAPPSVSIFDPSSVDAR